MGITRKSPREQALAEVEKHGATVGKWEAERLTAERELASLQARAGEEVLADETAAGRLTSSMGKLRDRIEIASRAVEAARPKLDAARSAVVFAEAADWDAEAEKRARVLEAHDARTAELLAQLKAHDRVEYGRVPDPDPSEWGNIGKQRAGVRSRHSELADLVEQARLTAWVLREVAEGRDPEPELARRASVVDGKIFGLSRQEYYPSTIWGPGAVLPVAAYQRAVEAKRTQLAQLDELAERLPREVEEYEKREAAEPAHVSLDGLRSRRSRLQSLPGERERAAVELAALTGEPVRG